MSARVEGITQLLIRWSNGDNAALDELMPIVYDELRRLARRYLRREHLNYTLESRALVHDAYLRLVDQRSVSFHNRAQFFGLAAKMMRNILVDHARAHRAQKRRGSQYKLSLSKADRLDSRAEIDLVALDDALNKLEIFKPRLCRIVELRFFAGLTVEETARELNVSRATVEREWNFARAWLRRELGG